MTSHITLSFKTLLTFAFALLMASPSVVAKKHDLSSDLKLLDDAIKQSPVYSRKKIASIDSLKHRLTSPGITDLQRLNIKIQVSDRYRPVNTDSALLYASSAIQFLSENNSIPEKSLPDCEIRCKIALLNALSTAGLFYAAQNQFDEISTQSLTPALKIEYWKAARQMYSYLKTYVAAESTFFDEYERRYTAYDDSLLSSLPASDNFYRFIKAERLVRDNNCHEAKHLLTDLMRRLPEESNLYGMAAYQLAEVYKREGNIPQFVTMLTKASISDIKGCVREGVALTDLAQWLYQTGELHEAFRFINFALSQANAGNARMRAVAIASLMPVIDSAYREKISDTNTTLTILIILITIFFILSLVSVTLLYRYTTVH